MYHILICDDETDIVNALKIYLSDPEYTLFTAVNGKEAVEITENNEIHLILMDIMMPVMDGITAMAKIREKHNLPIILLTAKSEDTDKILGLNVGADDYITKPFSMPELLARVKANIRRRAYDLPAAPESADQSIGGLVIDMTAYVVRKNGVELDLTQKEFDLLRLFASTPGKVFSREELMEKVWNYEYYGDMRTVDVTIRRLRGKLEDDAANPTYILTRRGVGYYFNGDLT